MNQFPKHFHILSGNIFTLNSVSSEVRVVENV